MAMGPGRISYRLLIPVHPTERQIAEPGRWRSDQLPGTMVCSYPLVVASGSATGCDVTGLLSTR